MISYILLINGKIEQTACFSNCQLKYLSLFKSLFNKALNDENNKYIKVIAVEENNKIKDVTNYFIENSLKYDPLKKALRLRKEFKR